MTVQSNSNSSFSVIFEEHEQSREIHAAGGLAFDVLARIEALMPEGASRTVETGCGRSTILFSNLVEDHTVFCLEDREYGDQSSVHYYERSDLFQSNHVTCVFGSTQKTLPTFEHQGQYDCVLIDGPHGYPFPDIEYFYFYPWIKTGGLLVVDDIQIASIGRMADILQEDVMWELVEIARTTAIFRRTDAPLFSNEGDGWWEQGYNQRRTEADKEFFLEDGGELSSFAERVAERNHATVVDKRKKMKKSIFQKLGF